MTIFRDEFDVRFIIMFGVLLFVKCFSWIGAGRVEFMEQQPPERPVLFHARLASSLVLLAAACGGLVWHAITSVLERGKPNMMVSGMGVTWIGKANAVRSCLRSSLRFC